MLVAYFTTTVLGFIEQWSNIPCGTKFLWVQIFFFSPHNLQKNFPHKKNTTNIFPEINSTVHTKKNGVCLINIKMLSVHVNLAF